MLQAYDYNSFYLATTDECNCDFPNTTLLVHSVEKENIVRNIWINAEEILTCATGALMNAALVGDKYRDEIIKMDGINCFTKILDERRHLPVFQNMPLAL